jgi:hypothetical protein
VGGHWPDQRCSHSAVSHRVAPPRAGTPSPRLDALLRELGHDADLLAARGQAVPDIARLRSELRMPADAWR